ncbi:DUF6086 family protein [Streptomyces sp. NPDC058961]|uniref:DUF6086 family protein n=1 Tax=Streptomyces sp. NPDC058961 TaxID=3346680 RepID=UPI0036B053D8
MSQYFSLGDVTLWNPSNGVSTVFLGQTAVFAEVLGLSSGIGPMEEDEAEVAPDSLAAFVRALLAWRAGSNHAVLEALSDGFIATMVVLAERAGVEVCWPGQPDPAQAGLHDVQVAPARAGSGVDWAVRVREQARQLDLAMVR